MNPVKNNKTLMSRKHHTTKHKPKQRNIKSKTKQHLKRSLHTKVHLKHPLSSHLRTFSTYSDFSELDDDLFDGGTPQAFTGPIIISSNEISQLTSQPSHQEQKSTQQHSSQSLQSQLPMTIYNVISGVSPTPVGVTVFRLSGPHSYHILSLLTRTPLEKIKKLSLKRIFTSTLYSIPDTLDDMSLLRDNNADSTKRRGVGDDPMEGMNDEFARQIHTPPSIWNQPDAIFTHSSKSPQNTNTNHNIQVDAKGIIPLASNDDIIDLEAMILSFHGPKSFTGEDTIELHVHGNPIIVKQLFNSLGKLTCAQVAKNGEFIQRAYLNNRLSLLQVEAYYDLIHSTNITEIVHASKTSKMNKDIMFVYNRWRHVLIESLAYLESIIDFGEDEGDIDHTEILKYIYPQVIAIRDDIQQLLQRKTREKVINGINVSILGEPNVGKSSLLNKVIGRQLAIVSAIPGTTRDIVSTSIEIDGLPVQIHDTAGIRDTTDLVEWEGIRRATALSQDVDYRIVLFDTTALAGQIEEILDGEYNNGENGDDNNPHDNQNNTNNNKSNDHKNKNNNNDNNDNKPLNKNMPIEFSPEHSQRLLDSKQPLTPLDQKISTLISSTLTAQHPSIKKLLTPRTLLVWTKSDLLPFTTYTHLQTMSSQPTTDPIYLQSQTKKRDEFQSMESQKVLQDIEDLKEIMKNQSVYDRSLLSQNDGDQKNSKNDDFSNSNKAKKHGDNIDKDALFDDLASQIADQRTLTLNNTHSSPNKDNNNSPTPSNVKLLNSIPMDQYLTNLTKRTIFNQAQMALNNNNTNNSSLSPQTTSNSIIDDVICVSSKYNYRITEISSSIHNFAHHTASNSLGLDPNENNTNNQNNDIMMMAGKRNNHNNKNNNTHNKDNNTNLSELALTSLFAKHDITLSTRHRQSLLLCFDALSAFIHQMAKVCNQPQEQQVDSDHILDEFITNHSNINTTTNNSTTSSTSITLPKAPRSALPSRDLDLVLSAASLRNAVNHIAEIDGQGEVHAEEVLDAVFNRFCIGK